MLKTAQTRLEGGVINLGVGHPALQMLPLRELQQAAEHRFAQGDAEFLQYGYEWGDGHLRAALAEYLSHEYGFAVRAEQTFISGGVSQALDLCCAALTQPGDTIIVEDPTYFFAFGIFRGHGLNIVPAPVDGEGLDLGALERLVQEHRPKLVYTIPTHQNPSGVTMTQQRREQLVRLAKEHGFFVLADEVYHLLTFEGTPPQSFARWGDDGQVISLGSFSKILAPGTRLGWINAREDVLERLAQNGMVVSGGGLSPLGSGLVRSVLELELLPGYVRGLRDTFRRRSAVLADTLDELRPLGVEFVRPDGGYFIWAAFPTDTAALLPLALSAGVRYQPGHLFSLGDTSSRRARLCFAFYEEPELRQGARRLAAALQSI